MCEQSLSKSGHSKALPASTGNDRSENKQMRQKDGETAKSQTLNRPSAGETTGVVSQFAAGCSTLPNSCFLESLQE